MSDNQQYPAPMPSTTVDDVDLYLSNGYDTVPGMSSRFAAAVCARLLRLQTEFGITGPIAEAGTFEGRFFIALGLALEPSDVALGIDLFNWPDEEIQGRFEANCAKHGLAETRRVTWKTDSRTMSPADILQKVGGRKLRFFHIDGDHSRDALTRDLDRAVAVMAPEGLIVLDDMLHPGYPTLMVAVLQWLERHPDWCPLCIIDRETIVAATKLVMCRRDVFKRYEGRMFEIFKENVWLLGADFNPDWCMVIGLDTRLAAIR